MTHTTPFWTRSLKGALIILASVAMWVEESLWQWFKWLTARIALFAWVQKIESSIRELPPYATMVVFLLPLSILLPFKFLAVYWLTKGYWFASLATIIAAKLVGTAIEARMFVVCKQKLLMIPWFCRLHDGLISIRDRLYAALRELPIYQAIRVRLDHIKVAARRLMNRLRLVWRNLRNRIFGRPPATGRDGDSTEPMI